MRISHYYLLLIIDHSLDQSLQQLENNELKLLVICHKLFLTIFMEFFSLE